MTKLTDAHLSPLVIAFGEGLARGDITVERAREFCDTTFNLTLAQQVYDGKTGNNAPRPERVRGVRPENAEPTGGGQSALERAKARLAARRADNQRPGKDEGGS